MSDSEQNKSEAPTPFKLSKAREKGQVARGMDLGFLASLSTFCLYMWIAGPGLRAKIQWSFQSALSAAGGLLDSPAAIAAAVGMLASAALKPLIGLGVAIFLVVLVGELIQTGFIFTAAPLKPDFGKLNPAQNLKKMFSVRMLVETGKNLLKMTFYVGVAVMVVRGAIRAESPVIVDADSLVSAMQRTAFRLLSLFVIAALAFAIFDQLIVRRDFLKKMRMSRRDVKRESRDREGDPRMKSKRKQLHGEFVKTSQSLRGVRGADVMITNPTHFAVALKYDPATMAAPKVVAQGAGEFALRLKRTAFLYGVTIVESRELARILYRCELNRPIPDVLFQSVAAIYLKMRKKSPHV